MNIDFSYFENKFKEIEIMVKSKTKFIDEIYRLNLEKIDRKILVDQLLEIHENGLNEHREKILKQIYAKRDYDLMQLNEDFNEIIQSLDCEMKLEQLNSDYINQIAQEALYMLQSKEEKIKKNFLHFDKCDFIDHSFNYYKYKFNQEIDFYKMDRYSKFVNIKKKVQLPANDYKILNINGSYLKSMYFLSLPLDKMFYYAQLNTNSYMLLICNSAGEILHSKEYHDLNEFHDHKFKVISTKIFILCEYESTSHVQVYDLKLNLIRELKFSGTINQNLTVMENGFVFNKDYKLVVYDINNFISKTFKTQCQSQNMPFFNYIKSDQLMFLDIFRFFFISKLNDDQYVLYSINRHDGAFLKDNFYINSDRLRLILFDNNSKCYCLYSNFHDTEFIELGFKLNVYSIDGENIFNIQWMSDLFCFNYKWSIVLNQNLKENQIEYEEYL